MNKRPEDEKSRDSGVLSARLDMLFYRNYQLLLSRLKFINQV